MISERWDLNSVIYMGDGFWDAFIFKQIKLGIAPQNAFYKAKEYAGYITKHNSGDRAVAEAALFILEKYFDKKFLQLR